MYFVSVTTATTTETDCW